MSTLEHRLHAWAAESRISPAALDQVLAYAMAHRNWIVRHGIPSSETVEALRACYGVPVASPVQRVLAGRMSASDEWAIINRYLHPPLPNGLRASAYWRARRFGKSITQTMRAGE